MVVTVPSRARMMAWGWMGGPSPEAGAAQRISSRRKGRWLHRRHHGQRQSTAGRGIEPPCRSQSWTWAAKQAAASWARRSPASVHSESAVPRTPWQDLQVPRQGWRTWQGSQRLGEARIRAASSSTQGWVVRSALGPSTAWVTRISMPSTGRPWRSSRTSGRSPSGVFRSTATSSYPSSDSGIQATPGQVQVKPWTSGAGKPEQGTRSRGEPVRRPRVQVRSTWAIRCLAAWCRAVSVEQWAWWLWAKCGERTLPFRSCSPLPQPGHR